MNQITHQELVEIFGPKMPLTAVAFLWGEGPPYLGSPECQAMTLDERREHLRKLATETNGSLGRLSLD